MPPAKIQLEKHYRNDSWIGMSIGPVIINGDAPTNSLAVTGCRLQFRDEDGVLGFELNTTGSVGGAIGLITIDNVVTWEITIPEQDITLDVGKWDWDFQTTDTEGIVLTIYKGTLTVEKDITRD